METKDFTPIETKEMLDTLLAERENAVRSEYADYFELKDKVQQYEHDALRRKVGEDMGVPAKLIARISGGTEEEMRVDARILLEALPKTVPPLREAEHQPDSRSALRTMLVNLNL